MQRFSNCIRGGAWLLTVLLSGCTLFEKDSGTTVAEGLVVDKDTGQPVPLAEVQVHAFSAGGSLGGGYGPALGGPYLADAQGHFSLSFEAKKRTTYSLDAYGPLGHFSVDDGVEVRNGQKNAYLRIPVQAPAWVRIKLIDEPPKITSGRLDTGGYAGNSDSYGLPLPNDVTYIRNVTANSRRRVSWIISDYSKGTIVENYKELTVPSLDTMTVEIRF